MIALGSTCAARAAPLGVLLGLFAFSVLLVGRRDGLRCLVLLGAAPALLLAMGWAVVRAGVPAMPAVLLAGLLAAAIQVLLLLGWRGGGSAALLGALGGFMAAVGCAALAVWHLRITGVHSTILRDVWFAGQGRRLDFHWLALGAMVLVGVGVIADLAVAVAATVREVHKANPRLPARSLFASGMRFGRDVISTEVNTLPLAVLGASLGGVLLVLVRPDVARWPYSWMTLANEQATGVEAAALLGGTIALVLTIPLTAALAARLWARRVQTDPAAPPTAHDATDGTDAKAPGRRRLPASWLWLAVVPVGAAVGAFVWLGGTSYRYPPGRGGTHTQLVRGRIVEAEPEVWPWAPRGAGPGAERLQQLTVCLADGRRVQVENPVTGSPVADKIACVGDRVIVRRQEAAGESYAMLSDVERDRPLLLGALAACLVVVVVGRWQGWRALAALAATGGAVCVLLWAIVRGGAPPVPATLLCMLAVTAVAYVIICGFSAKALAAGAGTLLGVGGAALAAMVFGRWLGLSGRYNGQLLNLGLYSAGRSLDFPGLLVAVTLIGSLGVVMDVSIGVASAVGEVRRADPGLRFAGLFASGMAVGRKIMAAMFGAILFAYAGLNLGLFMLPWLQAGSAGQVFTSERVLTEVVRLLAAGLAIAWTIPVTAAVGACLGGRRPAPAGGTPSRSG